MVRRRRGGEVEPAPVVGLVVVTHRAEYLAECLASVRAQTVAPARAVLVDNASPAADRVGAIAASYGFETLRVDRSTSLGTARNLGCQYLDDCTFIASLDGDDEWCPTYLARYLAEQRRTGADVVYGAAELFGTASGVWFAESSRGGDLRGGNFVPANSLFRRAAWQAAGGFDPGLAFFEDWDLWLSLAEAGATFAGIDEPLWRYRRHDVSMLGASLDAQRAAARRTVRAKHLRYIWGPLQWRRHRRNVQKYLLRSG